jgi:TolB-like protein
MRQFYYAIAVAVLAAIMIGCGGRPTVFLHDEYNFQFLERVAIIPFDNLSSDRGAGPRATRIFLSQLLASKAFDVVEPGEVTLALGKYATVRTSELTNEQILELGKRLRVQGIFLGTVTESAVTRSGSATVNTVSMVVRLVETETGETVWSATGSAGGRGFWASLFGGGGSTATEATRDCVKKILNTLLD